MKQHHIDWRKSSYSAPSGDCVEIAKSSRNTIGIRDSKAGDRSPIIELHNANGQDS
ncbi:hypothetical protein GCM10022254_77520 [Actinomadura meridiana]|uniref:DUF397 domain-containing protein n=1 Tax=Actinomadura meridiana TaxID=559626 RepID=A0ABP8CSF7_9ACTN